jgi:mRNA interferase RelE/StbE
MLKLDIKKPAFDSLVGLQPKPFKQVMLSIVYLTETPCPHASRRLTGYPFYRIDAGECRVIYDVEAEESLRVLLIGKRH